MTSIRDIPYEDVKEFLISNNRNVPDHIDKAYDRVFRLLKNTKFKGTKNYKIYNISN